MKTKIWTKIAKLSFLTISVGIFSLLTFYYFSQMLLNQASSAWPMAFSGALFLAVFVLQVFFVRDLKILIPVSIVQGALSLVPFLSLYRSPGFNYFIGSAAVILIFFIVSAVLSGRDILDNSLKIQFFSVANRIVPKLLIGILVFLLVASYFHLFHLNNFDTQKGKKVFNTVLNNSKSLVHVWIPGLNFDMTMEEAINRMAEVQINRSKVEYLQKGIVLSELPEEARSRITGRVANQIENKIEGMTNISVDPSQRLRDYLFSFVENEISSLSNIYIGTIQISLFVLLFFTLKTLMFIIYIPVELLAFLFYKFLIMTNFATVIYKTKSKEVIAL